MRRMDDSGDEEVAALNNSASIRLKTGRVESAERTDLRLVKHLEISYIRILQKHAGPGIHKPHLI